MPTPHEQSAQPTELSPIPESAPLDGWKEVPIAETDLSSEPLVPVGIFSEHRKIVTSSAYAGEHHSSPYTDGLEGSNMAVFVREGVAERLEEAADMLPEGCHLMVMDAYRSYEVQEALYKQYEQKLIERHPGWTSEEISTEVQKYVSLPSTDETRPSPHNTGASVDVVIIKVEKEVQEQIDAIDGVLDNLDGREWEKTYLSEMRRSELIRRYGRMLNFGTRFDYGGPEAALRYFEEKAAESELNEEEREALESRRLLFNVMTAAGFEPYEDEWWHFNDPASQMGAKVAGREYAEYGAVELSEDNLRFNDMRRRHHVNSVRLARGEEWEPPEHLETHYSLAKAAIYGDNPKNVWSLTDTVDRIEPPEDQIAVQKSRSRTR